MASRLEFRLLRVKCEKETGVTVLGSDDIAVGGVAVNPDGSTAKIAEFKVGEFDKGESKPVDRRLALFDLRNGGGFPKSFAVTLVLAEKDHGGLTKLLDRLPKQISDHVIDAVKSKVGTVAGGVIGGSVGVVGGPVGIAIGSLVGAEATKIFGTLKGALGDDVFPPETVDRTIRSADEKLNDARQTVVFRGHGGKYLVSCEWRLI